MTGEPFNATQHCSFSVDADGAAASDRLGSAVRSHRVGYRFFRRTLDVAVAFVALVVSLPMFLLVAMMIRLSGRGPVFFTQDRIGLGGERFVIVKFRTMRVGTHIEVIGDDEERSRYVANGYKLSESDPRITRAGRWLRKTSLDELPQLINVLSGQMSIVGVRPLVPDEFAGRSLRDRQLYAQLRPGLTGLWQIAGRSSLDAANRVALDRRYLETCSVRRDLVILMRTPMALFRVSDAQ